MAKKLFVHMTEYVVNACKVIDAKLENTKELEAIIAMMEEGIDTSKMYDGTIEDAKAELELKEQINTQLRKEKKAAAHTLMSDELMKDIRHSMVIGEVFTLPQIVRWLKDLGCEGDEPRFQKAAEGVLLAAGDLTANKTKKSKDASGFKGEEAIRNALCKGLVHWLVRVRKAIVISEAGAWSLRVASKDTKEA